jgi:hypothetical protein
MVLSTNFSSVPTFGSVTLPNGSVLSNYKKVQITYFALNAAAAFKAAYLFASNSAIPNTSSSWGTTLGMNNLIAAIPSGNPISGQGSYKTVTFDLTDPAISSQTAIAALTTSTVFFGFGESGGVASGITPLYFVDDITLIP